MDANASDEPVEGLKPKESTLLKSSMVMASGTLVSRVLGFIRTALLVAVLGTSAGAADSFTVANTLPNMVYNLLAAGIIDAILIPQIVRALKGRAGSEYVNKLLTAAGLILFGLTVVAMIGTPVIVTVLASGFTPEMRALTITFALICVPQIFFYGLYNLLGELLNARGIFGPYMWAPVVNNIVGIASLILFLSLWGGAGEVRPAESMTSPQIAVVAGLATLGVISQALILLIPMRKSGLKLKIDLRLKGTNFGSASKVAWWTFATLMLSQVGVVSTSQLASRAGAWTAQTGEVVAGVTAYQNSFMMFMVPQSLIALTLATAIFTRLANDITDHNYEGAAYNYHRGVELIMLLTFFAAAVLLVAATPVMQLIMPTFGQLSASMYGNVLVALIFALPSVGIILMSQRMFFALEDAKPVFLSGIIPVTLQVIVGWGVYSVADAQWWTIGAAAGETVSRIVQGFIILVWVGHAVRQVNVGRLFGAYMRYFCAFALSALAGWGVMHFLGAGSNADTTIVRFFDSLWQVAIVAAVIAIIYFGLLMVIDRQNTRTAFSAVLARFRPPAISDEESALSSDQAAEAIAAALAETEIAELGSESTLGLAAAARTEAEKEYERAEKSAAKTSEAVKPAEIVTTPEISEAYGVSTPPSGKKWEEQVGKEAAAEWEDLFDEDSGVPAPRIGAPTDLISTGPIPVISSLIPPPPGIPGDGGGASIASGSVAKPRELDSENGSLDGEEPPVTTGSSKDTVLDFSSEHSNVVGIDQGKDIAMSGAPTGPGEIPSSPALQPRKRKFDPTIPALVIGVLIVVVSGTLAWRNLLPPAGMDFFPEIAQSEPQSLPVEEEVVEETTNSVTGPPPVISSATVFSWADDDGDHPELAGALFDGDPSTIWRSRYFSQNQFEEGSEIAILLNLAEPAVVSEISLSVIGEGGELVVRNSTDGNPRQGDILATTPLTSETVIKLAQPTELSSIGLVFNTLPVDDEGSNRAKVTGISIK